MEQLYERKLTKKSMESGIFEKKESEVEGDELKDLQKSWDQMLRFRSGISPVTKNVRNIRYKKKPEFDVEKVKNVETILKDLIDTGFADHVDEVLLEFNDEGKLEKKIEGNQKKPQDQRGAKDGFLQRDDDDLISGSGSEDDESMAASSVYTKSMKGGAGKSVVKSEITSEMGKAF
jgi:hypothetical protein